MGEYLNKCIYIPTHVYVQMFVSSLLLINGHWQVTLGLWQRYRRSARIRKKKGEAQTSEQHTYSLAMKSRYVISVTVLQINALGCKPPYSIPALLQNPCRPRTSHWRKRLCHSDPLGGACKVPVECRRILCRSTLFFLCCKMEIAVPTEKCSMTLTGL